MTTIEITCSVCGAKVQRYKSEVSRSRRMGRKLYCSNKCSGKDHAKYLPVQRSTAHLNARNREDEHSPFRWHLRNAERRHKKECNLTLQDLKSQWEKQKGICPYTGWELKNLKNTSFANQLPLTPDRASLDRIDSSKGYVKGNVQFVSYMAQCAKNCFSSEDVLKFGKAVADNASTIVERTTMTKKVTKDVKPDDVIRRTGGYGHQPRRIGHNPDATPPDGYPGVGLTPQQPVQPQQSPPATIPAATPPAVEEPQNK